MNHSNRRAIIGRISAVLICGHLAACAAGPAREPAEDEQEQRLPQGATLEIGELIEPHYRGAIGQVVSRPKAPPSRPARVERLQCHAACDAVVPGQTLFTLRWRDPVASPGPTAPAYRDDSRVRLDIAGTPQGFDAGNFSTIELRNVPFTGVGQPMTGRIPQPARGQVLLNRVEAGRIVPRPDNLPLFRSTRTMMQSLPSLPPDVSEAVQREMQAGSLSQVRVLGRSAERRRGAATQAVTMIGLQPGLTYRFRMVEQTSGGGEVIGEQSCHVPVCPADYNEGPR